jgi:hypothetical protein
MGQNMSEMPRMDLNAIKETIVVEGTSFVLKPVGAAVLWLIGRWLVSITVTTIPASRYGMEDDCQIEQKSDFHAVDNSVLFCYIQIEIIKAGNRCASWILAIITIN